MSEQPKPKQAIRRFDVFAEYNKLKSVHEGRPLEEAKGYGLWLAKVVASRRYGAGSQRKSPQTRERSSAEGETPAEHERFRSLEGVPQTDELFDREIVARMGDRFYHEVFAPAIADHFSHGHRYEDIRDIVRQGGSPPPGRGARLPLSVPGALRIGLAPLH